MLGIFIKIHSCVTLAGSRTRGFFVKKCWEKNQESSGPVLLCPGPVNVSPATKKALLKPYYGHREPEFKALLSSCRNKIRSALRVPEGMLPVIFTGSGTVANEAVISSFRGRGRVLVLSNGEFGERLAKCLTHYEIEHNHLLYRWGQEIDLDSVEKSLKLDSFACLMVVHHETSTGQINPIGEIGRLAQFFGTEMFVDCVSSLGAEVFDFDLVDYCTVSSNKALASEPGLSIVIAKKSRLNFLLEHDNRPWYLNLGVQYEMQELHQQTLNTPAIPLFYALEQALMELIEDSLEARFAHYDDLSYLIRTSLGSMGFNSLLSQGVKSRVLTTFVCPSRERDFVERIREKGFILFRGKGRLQSNCFQVANIGHINKNDVERFIFNVREVVT